MCGIVALWRRGGRPVTAAEVGAMRDLLAHRGPDGVGLHLDGAVGLGHRRLTVIDLEGGQQPMANHDGTVHLVFNGEIYNYQALRATLQEQGVPLHSHCDTETILGLYDLYGVDCLDHLCGMFAFILWDSRRQRLLAARDRLGIKPLYVFRHGATVAFTSEIKALGALEEFVPRVEEEAIPEYLAHRNLAGRRTLFQDVERLLPGERLVVDRDAERRDLYWQLPHPTAAADDGDEASWGEAVNELLDRVVGEHLVSDVPLGTFNSGGLDSSLVTALVAKRGDDHLNTYSVGFRDAAFDESPYADLVAERWGTRHHKLYVRGEDEYADLLPRAVWHHDEPLNHPHSVHLLHLSRLARRRVTVVLTGEGADELFAGYPRYRLAGLLDRLPWRGAFLLGGLRLAAGLRQGKERLRVRAVLPGGGAVHLGNLAAFVAPQQVAGLLTPRLRDVPAARAMALAPGDAALPEALWIDQQTYLQSLLQRMDKMSMAASLEGRVPFLDHRMVELAARVPPGLKLHHGRETKYLLKAIARNHLPAAIIERPKAGFAVPIAAWLRPGGPLASYLGELESPRSLDRGVFAPAPLRACIAAHREGRHDHGELLWGAINLELWHRLLIDGDALPAAAAVDLSPAVSAGVESMGAARG